MKKVFSTQKVKAFLPFVMVIFLYAGLRLIFLDHMTHGDERHWVGRSLNFYRALATGEFEHTFQKEHPGVMTMWAGALGYLVRYPGILSHLDGNSTEAYTNTLQMWTWGMQPPEVLVALRASKVILQTIFFAISLAFLTPLVGRTITLLFGVLLALSTTLLGVDSWLHIDGLAAIAGLAGVSAVLYAGEHTSLVDAPTHRVRWLWFLAGAICATSWLNRITGLMLVVVVVVVLLLQLLAQQKRIAGGSQSGKGAMALCLQYGILWTAGGAIATVALFPALWINPMETVRTVIGLPISGAMGTGPQNFFSDTIVDKGWLYYPKQIIIRTTPFEWAGIVAIVVLSHLAWKKELVPRAAARMLPVVLIFAAVYLLGLSLSPKKAFQYSANVYPMITLAASVGLIMLSRSLVHWAPRMGKVIAYLLVIGAVSYSAVATVQSLPYKNAYNNPLGLRLTGETYNYAIRPGYPQIADFFIELDTESPTNVGFSSGGFRIIMRYMIPPSLGFDFTGWSSLTSPAQWYEQDYQIVGADYPSDLTWHRYGSPPLFKLEVQGRVYWEVYPNDVVKPYKSALVKTECTTTFGEHATLYQIQAMTDVTDFYFVSENGQPVIVEVFEQEGSAKHSIGQADVGSQRQGYLFKVSLGPLELDATDGRLSSPLLIHVYDAASGDLLAATSTRESVVSDYALVNSDCFYRPEL